MPSTFCPGCRRPVERCACDDPEEPRASRAPEGHVPIDPMFAHAAASGFAPLTEDAKAAFKEKAGIFLKVVVGQR